MTDLEKHIQDIRVCDTHEHQKKENDWVENGSADVVIDLFSTYVAGDLRVAGITPAAFAQLDHTLKSDPETRWKGIRGAWPLIQWTGFGEAVRLQAKHVYGIEIINEKNLLAAQSKLMELREPGMRLKILRDWAKLDHVQVDDFCWPCLPDASGPDFFLYDIRWADFCRGEIDFAGLTKETGVTVMNLATLREAFEKLVAKYGPCAIAIKAQHAYDRTLRWIERSDEDAERALQLALSAPPRNLDASTKLCLGDWCWARGAELAAKHNLPFKLHTGYMAGSGYMEIDGIRSGHLCGLLKRYPDTRFVLMHIAYPYTDELIAVAKHFPNVWVDLCWAWSIDPQSSMNFVRQFIHAVPLNKLFGFGGDTGTPTAAFAYALQTRKWMTKTLQAEVSDGEMTEKEAIGVATRLLRENQLACFDVEGRRATIRRMLAGKK